MIRRFYFGTCWKQKLFPIFVFLLHQVPAFVIAEHRFTELPPGVFLGVEIIPNVR